MKAISLLLLMSVTLHANGAAQDIDVRLFELASPRQLSVIAIDGGVQLFAGEFKDPLMTLSRGEEAIVSRASDQLHVHLGDMRLFAKSLRVEPVDGGEIGVGVREGREIIEGRPYSGLLLISPDSGSWELKVFNSVSLEEYVASVVSSEYGLDDLEGSKAMAVIARTYALAALLRPDNESDLSDHTLSQVYRGSGEVTETARQAARETEGEVATHEGALIEAVYFSSSGGHTANNDAVWSGGPLPYLRGKPDPYDDVSPHTSWTSRVSRTQLLAKLSDVYGEPIEGFVLGDRSSDGRVVGVELLRRNGSALEVSANEFRLHVINQFGPRSLRSTLFDARREGDEYVMEGSGYGHGVGLSQWGAHGMARQGSSYREILDFYYTGVEVAQLDESNQIEPPARPVSLQSDPPPADRRAGTQRIGW